MNLGISTVCYHRQFASGELDLLGCMKLVRDYGLNALELHESQTPRAPEALARVRRAAAELGLDLIAVSPESNFYCADFGGTIAQLEHLLDWLDVAAFVGAPVLRVNTGPFCLSVHDYAPASVSREQLREWCVQHFRVLARAAARKGLVLALENHGGLLLTSEEILAFLRDVGSEWLRANIDTGNWYRDLRTHDEPIEEPCHAVEALADAAAFCHAKVFDITNDLLEPTLDYARIFAILKEHGYRGAVSIEYFGEDVVEATPRIAAMLRKFAAEAGMP